MNLLKGRYYPMTRCEETHSIGHKVMIFGFASDSTGMSMETFLTIWSQVVSEKGQSASREKDCELVDKNDEQDLVEQDRDEDQAPSDEG